MWKLIQVLTLAGLISLIGFARVNVIDVGRYPELAYHASSPSELKYKYEALFRLADKDEAVLVDKVCYGDCGYLYKKWIDEDIVETVRYVKYGRYVIYVGMGGSAIYGKISSAQKKTP